MRIIAEQDSSSRWIAWWDDNPEELSQSGSVLGAVARLLLQSCERNVQAGDLKRDTRASCDGHVEMVVASPAMHAER